MSTAKAIRWGILATGGIAKTFAKDLLIDPKSRQVSDIKHVIGAVGSSSSLSSADKFISDVVSPSQSVKCTAHSSYESLVKDPSVDIIYVATPHSVHYQNVMLCLTNDKPVLCEKPFTVNAAQAKELYKIARERNLFLMEAVWTRFLPISQAIRTHVTNGDIGDILRVMSDLSLGIQPEEVFDAEHRMVNLELAGGALLDLGVYSLAWVFQTMYHTLSPQLQVQSRPEVLGTGMTFDARTGADESTTILLEFPKSTPSGKMKAHAVVTASMRVLDDPAQSHSKELEIPVVRIQGEKGEIQVFGPSYCPTRFRLVPRKGTHESQVVDRTFGFEDGAHGMVYEADDAARCVLAGKLESQSMPWHESLLIIEVTDEARKQAGLVYPDTIESTEYPVRFVSNSL